MQEKSPAACEKGAGTTERVRGRAGLALNLAPQGGESLSLLPNEQKLRRERQAKTRVRDQEEKRMPQSEQLEVLVLGSGISFSRTA